MEPLLKDLLTNYGPLALGWIVALALGWRVYNDTAGDRLRPVDVLKKYDEVLDAYHAAIVENTKVTERLAMLIEERTRRQTTNGH